MILHRLVVLFGTVAVVVVACSTEGRKRDNDDGNTSNNASSSTGPGPTEKCEDQCAMEHPAAGVELYTNLRKCLLCYACANVCKNEQGGTCTEGFTEGGCSAQAMTCTECLNSPCALVQNPDTTFAGKCAETGNADACAASMDCVGMNNCVANCVAMQTTSSTGSMTSTGSMATTGTMTSTGSM